MVLQNRDRIPNPFLLNFRTKKGIKGISEQTTEKTKCMSQSI